MSYYSTSAVDRIAREIVSEEMVDHAIMKWSDRKSSYIAACLESPWHRAKVRRNIAIGINAGSYSIALFEAEQALRRRVLVKV